MRAAAFFAVAVVIHNADHLRRGVQLLARDVFAVGTLAIVFEVAIVVLVCQRHRLAPLAAAVGGVALAGGYVIVHFLPARPWLSDSFISSASVSPLSWFAASLEVVAALTLALVGVIALRWRGGLTSAPDNERSLSRVLTHPLALTFGLTQAVTLIASVGELFR